ncbi:MAG: aldo/keto reductase [Proteobacteria bacterium]|nr:aldo/keto reductase [Pseudomonadota bacterium]
MQTTQRTSGGTGSWRAQDALSRPSRLSKLLSRLGFGAAPIGNLYAEVGEDDAQAALVAAWKGGIRYFDTAPYYGHGLSESRLGRAFAVWPRDSYAVSTKVGRRIEVDVTRTARINDGFAVSGTRAVFDYSADGVLRSFEASLQRLGVERVDALLLHDVGRLTHGERHGAMLRQALDEALPAMAALRDAGAVGAIGIGVNEIEVCEQILPRFDLDCIMLAGRYTLLESTAALGLFAQTQARGVGMIVAGPYNSGLLGGAQVPGSTYNYAPVDAATLARARKIYSICAGAGVDAGAAALQFPLAHPAVAAVVAGLRSAGEADSAAVRRDTTIPAAIWNELRDDGILDPSAPVPRA